MWLISFPLVCAIMLWFSLDLAVLVRVGSGRRRRANARRAIERLIMSSPLASATAASVVQSPSPVSSPTTDRPRTRFDAAAGTQAAESTAGYTSSSGNEDNYGGRVRAAALQAAAGKKNSSSSPAARVRRVVVPAALRIATRAVVRRAVVLVGGDFARSPRMQYHAASLARSGLFDEVLLVGLDCGNLLSEDLLVSGEPQPEPIVTREGGSGGSSDATPAGTLAGTTATSVGAGMEHAVYDVQARLESSELQPGSGCIVSTCYLAAPPAPPEWLQVVVPLNSLHWVVCTLYRVVALTGLFVLQTVCATATRINEHGQLLVTDLVFVQTPPAVPFVLLIRYLVCPLVFAYNVLLYYGVVVPAAWMNPGAMRDVRQQCRLQSLRFTGTGAGAGRGRRRATAATPAKAARTSGVLGATRPVRRWVFYPAVVVDWHNFGHTILAQNQRPTTAVQLYKALEMHLCAGHVNITVSQAMRRALECAYPRLKRSRARDGAAAAVAAAAGVAAAAEDGEVADGLASAPALAGAPPPLSPSPRAVTVLHDVAPAFFKPVPRSHCVRQVLERVLLRHHQPAHNATTAAAVTLTAGNGNGGYTAAAAASSPFALVSKSELEDMGWGLAGPPPWIFAEAAAASVPGSPATATATAAAASATTLQRRGIMIVGATSWTEDDDYTVLLQALQRLDHRLQHELAGVATAVGTTNHSSSTGGFGAASGPVNLWVLITGKGPARRRFEEAVRAAKLSSHVVVSTYYAQSYQEYSLLLGAADAGLCLHFSSSGLDLPMKGVDMVGAGLPIIALQYPAIGELMGGVTRVLATQSASRCRGGTASTFSNGTADCGSGLGKALPPSLQECERGWLFCTCADLEVLLAAFVGLSAASETVSDGASCTVLAPPTPLSVMKRRAGEARLHAATWQENWTKVLLPVLKQVV